MGSQCCKGEAANNKNKPTSISSTSSRFGARGDQELIGDRYGFSENNNTVHLSLQQVTRADVGHYTLVAKNAGGEVRRTMELRVEERGDTGGPDAPAFLRRLSDLAVKVGTRTRFLVEIRSSSDTKVTWHRRDMKVLEGERFRFLHEGNFFCVDVAPVMTEDGGRWTCMAENDGGRSSCSSHLNVLVPKAYKSPEFLEELQALLTECGTVSLECKVIGVPTPVLRWYKDGKEIKAGDVFALTANPDDPTSLGTYTCEAANCMGKTYSSSRVHVVGKGSREGSLKPADSLTPTGPPPIFTQELTNKKVKIGEPITLACTVGTPPWPKSIVWYNSAGRVEECDKYHVMEDGLGGYMVEILAADAEDDGQWKCVATNFDGSMGFSQATVTMQYPKNYRKPRFLESLKAILTEEGLVSFECKVVGFPTPQLRWFKDGQELKPGDVYQLTGTNSLGSYSCIAKNVMGEATSSAELTVEDIQSQLNEEERMQLFSTNQPPKFIQGLKSSEAKINEDYRLTVLVSISPEPQISWYRDDEQMENTDRYLATRESRGACHMDIKRLEIIDQAEWKCVATNDFGHSVTSCFLKLSIPKHFKRPRFLECLRAILSEEGAVNLECKVIGVPQPVLKWYKDGEELKPGDIHRIISGQDGTCCLGTYTCEAQNCMGTVASSASLLGFEDRMLGKGAGSHPAEQSSGLASLARVSGPHMIARDPSLSTIHEERTSQMYDPATERSLTVDERADVSFSFDGKEVSVSLYETPDLTEEEALQVVEMYADELSEHVSEHNVVELPPLRFVKQTSTSSKLLREAVVIDVSPDYFASAEDDLLRTDADVEDLSISEAGQHPALPQDLDDDGAFDELEADDVLDRVLSSGVPYPDNITPQRPPRKKTTSRGESDTKDSDASFHSLSGGQAASLGKTAKPEEKSDVFTEAVAQTPGTDSNSKLESFGSAKGSVSNKKDVPMEISDEKSLDSNKRKQQEEDDERTGKKTKQIEPKLDHGTQTGPPKKVMRSIESGQGESFENISRNKSDTAGVKVGLLAESEQIKEEDQQAVDNSVLGETEVLRQGREEDKQDTGSKQTEEVTPKLPRKSIKRSSSKDKTVEGKEGTVGAGSEKSPETEDVPPVVLRRKKSSPAAKNQSIEGDQESPTTTPRKKRSALKLGEEQTEDTQKQMTSKDDSYSEEGDGLKTLLRSQQGDKGSSLERQNSSKRRKRRDSRRSSSFESNKDQDDEPMATTLQTEIENITQEMTDREKRLSGLEFELPRFQSPELLETMNTYVAEKSDPSLIDNLTQSLQNIQKGLASVEGQVKSQLPSQSLKSSLSVLESLSQPISDIQKGLALAEEKSSSEELTPGKSGMCILESLSQPIKEFQRGIAQIEQQAFETGMNETALDRTKFAILENVAQPVEEFQRGIALIQQQAMLEAGEESLADVPNLPLFSTPAQELQKALGAIAHRTDIKEESTAETPSLKSYATPPQGVPEWQKVFAQVGQSGVDSEESLADAQSFGAYVSPVEELQKALTQISKGAVNVARKESTPSVRSYATPPQELFKPLAQIGDKVMYESEPLIQMTNVPVLQAVVQPVQAFQRQLATLEQQADKEARSDEPIFKRASVAILESLSQIMADLRQGIFVAEQQAGVETSDQGIGSSVLATVTQPMEELELNFSLIEQQAIVESGEEEDVLEATKFTMLKALASPIQQLVRGLSRIQNDYLFGPEQQVMTTKLPMLENIEQSIKEVERGIELLTQVSCEKVLDKDEKKSLELLHLLSRPLVELQRGIVQIERNIILEDTHSTPEQERAALDRISLPLHDLENSLSHVERFTVELSADPSGSSNTLELLSEPLYELKKSVIDIQEKALYGQGTESLAMLATLSQPLHNLQQCLANVARQQKSPVTHTANVQVVQSLAQSIDDLKLEVARIEYRTHSEPRAEPVKATLSMLGNLAEPLHDLHRGLIYAEQTLHETEGSSSIENPDLSTLQMLTSPLKHLREGLTKIEKLVFEDVTQLQTLECFSSFEMLSPVIHELQEGIACIHQQTVREAESEYSSNQARSSLLETLYFPLQELQRSLSTIIEEPPQTPTEMLKQNKSCSSILENMTQSIQTLRRQISILDETQAFVQTQELPLPKQTMCVLRSLAEPLFELQLSISQSEQQVLGSSDILLMEQESIQHLELISQPIQELAKQLTNLESSRQISKDGKVSEAKVKNNCESLTKSIQELHKGIEVFEKQNSSGLLRGKPESSVAKILYQPLHDLDKSLVCIENSIQGLQDVSICQESQSLVDKDKVSKSISKIKAVSSMITNQEYIKSNPQFGVLKNLLEPIKALVSKWEQCESQPGTTEQLMSKATVVELAKPVEEIQQMIRITKEQATLKGGINNNILLMIETLSQPVTELGASLSIVQGQTPQVTTRLAETAMDVSKPVVGKGKKQTKKIVETVCQNPQLSSVSSQEKKIHRATLGMVEELSTPLQDLNEKLSLVAKENLLAVGIEQMPDDKVKLLENLQQPLDQLQKNISLIEQTQASKTKKEILASKSHLIKTLVEPMEELQELLTSVEQRRASEVSATPLVEQAGFSVLEYLSQPIQVLKQGLDELEQQLKLEEKAEKMSTDLQVLQSVAQPLKEMHRSLATIEQQGIVEELTDESANVKLIIQPVKKLKEGLNQITEKILSENKEEGSFSVLQALVQPIEELEAGLNIVAQSLSTKGKTVTASCGSEVQLMEAIVQPLKDLQMCLSQIEEQQIVFEGEEVLSKTDGFSLTKAVAKTIEDLKHDFVQIEQKIKVKELKAIEQEATLKALLQPFINLQHGLSVIEGDMITEKAAEHTSSKLGTSVAESILHPIAELQSTLAKLEQQIIIDANEGKLVQNLQSSMLNTVSQPITELQSKLAEIEQKAAKEDGAVCKLSEVAVVKSLTQPLEEFQRCMALIDQNTVTSVLGTENPQESEQKLLELVSKPLHDIQCSIAHIEQLINEGKEEASEMTAFSMHKSEAQSDDVSLKNLAQIEQQMVMEAQEMDVSGNSGLALLKTIAQPIQEIHLSVAHIEQQLVLEGRGDDVSEMSLSALKTLANPLDELQRSLVQIEQQVVMEGRGDSIKSDHSELECLKTIARPIEELQRGIAQIEQQVILEAREEDFSDKTNVSLLKTLAQPLEELQRALAQIEVQVAMDGRQDLSEQSEISILKTIALPVEELQRGIAIIEQQMLLEPKEELMSDKSDLSNLKTMAQSVAELQRGVAQVEQQVALAMREEEMSEKSDISNLKTMAHSVAELHREVAQVEQQVVLAMSGKDMSEKSDLSNLKTVAHSVEELQRGVAQIEEQVVLAMREEDMSEKSDLSGLKTVAHSVEELQRGVAQIEQQVVLAMREQDMSETSDLSKLKTKALRSEETLLGVAHIEQQQILEPKEEDMSEKTDISLLKVLANPLEELQRSLAQIEQQVTLDIIDDEMSLKSEMSLLKTLAHPVQELQRGIAQIEQQIALDAREDDMSDKTECSKLKTLAHPLEELHRGLAQIEQQVVLEAKGKDISENMGKLILQTISSPVEALRSGIAQIEQQLVFEGREQEMSEKSDLSLIKTLAVSLEEIQRGFVQMEHQQILEAHGESISDKTNISLLKTIAGGKSGSQQGIALIQEQMILEPGAEVQSGSSIVGLRTLANPVHEALQTLALVQQQHTLEYATVLTEKEDISGLKTLAKKIQTVQEGLIQIDEQIILGGETDISKLEHVSLLVAMAQPIRELQSGIALVTQQHAMDPNIEMLSEKTDIVLLETLAKPLKQIEQQIALIEQQELLEPAVEPISEDETIQSDLPTLRSTPSMGIPNIEEQYILEGDVDSLSDLTDHQGLEVLPMSGQESRRGVAVVQQQEVLEGQAMSMSEGKSRIAETAAVGREGSLKMAITKQSEILEDKGSPQVEQKTKEDDINDKKKEAELTQKSEKGKEIKKKKDQELKNEEDEEAKRKEIEEDTQIKEKAEADHQKKQSDLKKEEEIEEKKKINEEEEMKKRDKDETERKKRDAEEAKKREETEAEKKKVEEDEIKNKEKAETELKKKEAEELKKKETAEAEKKKKEEEKKIEEEAESERKKKEAEELKKAAESEAEKKKIEEESREKENADTERKKKEAEELKIKKKTETERKKKEAEDEKKKKEEDEKSEREKAETERKKKEVEELNKKEEVEAEKKKREEQKKEKEKTENERKKKEAEELEKKEKAENERKKKEAEELKKTEEAEAQKKIQEEQKKKEKEQAGIERKEKEVEELNKKEKAETERKKKETEELKKKEEAEAEKKKQEKEKKEKEEAEIERKKREAEELEKREKAETEKKKMEAEELKKREEAEAETKKKEEKAKKQKEKAETERKKKEEEEEIKKKEEAEAEKKKKKEEEKMEKENAEAERKKVEAEELKKKEEAEAEKKKVEEEKKEKERAEAERKKKEAQELEKKEKAEKERKMKEAEELKKKEEAEAEKKKDEEKKEKEKAETEQKKREAEELRKKQEAEAEKKKAVEEEKQKKEKAEIERKKKEAEELKKTEEAEAKKKKKEEEEKMEKEKAETERKKIEAEELKKKQEAEAETRKVEEEKQKKEKAETERKKKEAEELKKTEEAETKRREKEEEEKKAEIERKKIEAEKLKKREEAETEKKKKEEEEKKEKEKAEIERKKKEAENLEKKEKAEIERKKKEAEELKKKEEAETEKKKEEEVKKEKEKAEIERKKKEAEELKKKEEAEAEKKKEEEVMKEKEKAEIERKKKEAENLEKKEKAEAERMKKEAEELKRKEEAEAEKKRKTEEEKQKQEKAETERQKKEAEELKKTKEAEAEKKKQEEKEKAESERKKKETELKKKEKAEAVKRKKEEEENKEKEKAEIELKKKEEEELKKKEESEAQKKKIEEEEKKEKEKIDVERKKKEAEELKTKEETEKKKKEDEEKKKKEKAETERKKKEAEELKKKNEEEAEKKRKDEEEIKNKEKAEIERKKREAEELKKKEEEAENKKKEEEQKKKKEEEEKEKKEKEKRLKEEDDKRKKEKAETERKKKESEELKKKEEVEAELKKKEAEELKKKEEEEKKKKEEEEKKKKAEEEAKKKEEAETERKKKEAEELKKKEAEELKKKEEEEKKKKDRTESERKKKEVKELKKKEEEAEIKKKEDEEKKKKESADTERKKKEAEELKKKEEDETKKKEEAEAEKKNKEDRELKEKEEEAKKKKTEEVKKKEKETAETDEKKKKTNEPKKKEEEKTIKKRKSESERKEDEVKKKEEVEIDSKKEEEVRKKIDKETVSLTDQKKTLPKEKTAKADLEDSTTVADEPQLPKGTTSVRRRSRPKPDDTEEPAIVSPRRRSRQSIDRSSDGDSLIDDQPPRRRPMEDDNEESRRRQQDTDNGIAWSAGRVTTRSRSFDHRSWVEESIEGSDTLTPSTLSTTLTPRVRARSRADDSSIASTEDISLDVSRRSRTRDRIEVVARDSQKKPSFCTRLTDRTAAQGSRIKLMCSVLGSPEPTVEWLRDGLPLLVRPGDSSKFRMRMEDGLAHLEVVNASTSDSAEYTCVARNVHGETSTTAKLKVFAGFEPAPFPPTFTRGMKDVYHFTDDELIMECRVRSQPPPRVTWFKDNVALRPSSRYQQTELPDGVCRLVISGPEAGTDSGMYTCRAENAIWSDQISHLVQFSGRDSQLGMRRLGVPRQARDTRRPHFSSVLTDHLVPTGGTIALQVEIRGAPKPDVTWLRGTEPLLTASTRVRTFEEAGVYTLMVADAHESEAGIYTCRASNAHGHVDTSAAVEVVRPGSVRGGKPAMFMSRPDQDMSVALGEDITVSFRVQGDPKPRVIWMKGTRDITNSQRSLKETIDDYVRFTLKRALPSDAGTYCILAKNIYGCDRSFVTVQIRRRARSLTPSVTWYPQSTSNILRDVHDEVERTRLKDVPGPVGGEPVVVESGRNWLTLAWPKSEQRGGVPVLAYRVEGWKVGEDGGARWAEMGVSPIHSFDAFNLKPGCEYKFRVTPRNRYGWGESVTTRASVIVGKTVELPEFVQILPGQLKALRGSNIRLECQVRGDPTPEVRWYRDGTELDPTCLRFTTDFNGTQCRLCVDELTDEDSGRYMCEATNKRGRVSTFARLLVVSDPKIWEADTKLKRGIQEEEGSTVDVPPQFTMRLRDRRVQMTYPVRLTCQVAGRPMPQVTWFRDGQELKQDATHTFWHEEHFHTLEISNASLEDSGSYSATARNSHGAVSCRCHLVVDKGIRAYVAPDFLSNLEAVVTIREGEELRMSAQVEAYPTVGVMWHRDGVRLRPSRRAIMTLDHDGSVELTLAGATLRDAGVYTCTATNEVGRAETTSRVTIVALSSKGAATLPQVIGPEIPYSKAPLWVTKPRSTEALEGDTVIIQCEVVGDPKPEVMWLRDWLKPDYYRDAPHFRRLGDGPQYRLEIPRAKLDFTGAYSVIARNPHGEVKAIISLQIYAKGQGKEDRMEHSSVKHGKVQTLPIVTRELKDLRCCDGDAVTLECSVQATPAPDVRWEKEGRILPLGGDFQADFDGSTALLSIHQVYPEDEGEYTCIVYNELGRSATSACLVVDVPEEKETLLSRTLSRPPGLLSAGSTPRSTPRTTPSRSKSPSVSRFREHREPTPSSQGGRIRRLKLTSPKFYAIPHNRIAEEGETIRFQCAIAGHPTPWVTWDKDGLLVTPSARLTITEHDDLRVLEVAEVTVEDAGLYRITLENEVGRVEASARLEVIGRHGSKANGVRAWSASPRSSPTFGRRLIGSAARVGSRLTLDCDIRGTPSPVPSWYRNGELIVMSSRVTPTWDGATARLEVKRVEPEDAGVYCCVAKNEAGVTQCAAKVTVLGADDPSDEDRLPPLFLQQLQEHVTTCEGRSLELRAQLSGSAPIEVVWSRDNVEVPDCEDFRYVSYDDGRVALRIADPFPEDAGVYRCEAFNRHGDAVTSGRLTITGETQQPPLQFVKKPSPVIISPGGTASFCARLVQDTTQPAQVRWTVAGVEVKTDSRYQTEEDGDVFMLHIGAATFSDAGLVTCTATSHDASVSCSTELRVMAPERAETPEGMPATLIVGPSDTTVLRGDRVVLKATFTGYPVPEVRWLRAGRELVSGGRMRIVPEDEGVSCLTLDGVTADEGGKYVVSVENCYGADCHFASVAVEGPPDPPAGQPSVSAGDAPLSCVVAWSSAPYDGGCIVTSYSVEMRGDAGDWRVLTGDCHSFSLVVPGLTSGEGYVFRVRANNIHGASEPGAESHRFTPNLGQEDEETFTQSFEPRFVSVESGADFKQRFDILEELGKGRFGVVHKVSDRTTGEKLAAKFIRCIKSKDREKVQEEIDIMNCLRHPKLLQLAAAFENPREIIMVMELISGGELFERVVADDFTLTERDCILFMRQIVEGVEYMHQNSVVHLDLKPENIMCYTRTSHRIKLIDFGLAKKLDPSSPVRVLFGTPEFIPPEIINYENIGLESDMWSVGVICYVLLSGLSPFMGDNDAETFANITRADFDFDDEAFDAISEAAKDFISTLLVEKKEKRLTASQCLHHTWLAQQHENMSCVKLSTDKLKKFIIRRKWQQRAIQRQAA